MGLRCALCGTPLMPRKADRDGLCEDRVEPKTRPHEDVAVLHQAQRLAPGASRSQPHWLWHAEQDRCDENAVSLRN